MSGPRPVLVTGGAGFVGANLSIALAAQHEVVALDNLRRRGSELNLPRLRAAGVAFVHGDVREAEDLLGLGPVEAIVEASAEPSVMAGVGGSPRYVLDTNLGGALNCLELARRDGAQLLFLSTSRVYPLGALGSVHLDEAPSRFELSDDQQLPGVSRAGIDESFPLRGARTFYGASKLAAELLVAEYGAAYGIATAIDRCGVIAGPWQMGKADQGVFTHWLVCHHFRRPLRYIGYGGTGKQVRDLLHVDDLAELVTEQLGRPSDWDGATVNVGGGREVSLSLREATELCAELTGNRLEIGSEEQERPGDVPLYLSDCTALHERTDWRPRRDTGRIMEDIAAWVSDNEAELERVL